MKRFIITFMLALCTALCWGLNVSAAVTNLDQYNFIPIKQGAGATELLQNADGSDAGIICNDDEVTLTYGGGNPQDRKRTTVELDLSCVSERKMKYVSFDMTAEQLMDLAVSMEPYDVSSYLDNRPHSLFLGNTGIMSVTIHTPRFKYEKYADAEGYKSVLDDNWWISTGNTINYTPYRKYNVVFIVNSMMVDPIKIDSSGAPIGESDEISVYIDGVRRGQLNKASHSLEAWRNDKLSFYHYVTGESSQKLTLENIEVGFCEKVIMEKAEMLDENADFWNFPDGDNATITLTVPTTSENAFLINSPQDESKASLAWYKTFGVCDSRLKDSFTASGESKSSYEDIYKKQTVHTWQGGDEIEVTFEINRVLKTIEVYTSLGHYRKDYYETEPRTIQLVNISGETKPTSVIAGRPSSMGFGLTDGMGSPKGTFREGDTLMVRAVGYGGESGKPIAIYTFNDAFGNIIKVEAKRAETYNNGFFSITEADEFGDQVPDGTVEMRLYLWDGGYRPLCRVIKATKENEIYEEIYSYEVSDAGRYRLTCNLGAGTAETDGDVIRVCKNGEMFWEQLMVNGEEQNLDVGLFADESDVITVCVGSEDGANTASYSGLTFTPERYFLSEERFPATSAGRKNSFVKKNTFGSYIGTTQGDNGTEIYSVQNDKKYLMKRNASTGRWWSTIEGDTGYVDKTVVRPGNQGAVASETIVETTLDRAGLLRFDGKLWLDAASDGVLAHMYINDELVWSNRVGGTRPVRWDEPYDVVYFHNVINVIARVNIGDKLKFVFNKWRRASHTDHYQLGNMTINYVRGDVLSKTTKWKLERSIVVDTQEKYIRRDGMTTSIDAISIDGDVYVSVNDIGMVLGGASNLPEAVIVDGKNYVSIVGAAEANGKYASVVAGRVAVVHDAIPVFIDFPEKSEIKTMIDCGESLFE